MFFASSQMVVKKRYVGWRRKGRRGGGGGVKMFRTGGGVTFCGVYKTRGFQFFGGELFLVRGSVPRCMSWVHGFVKSSIAMELLTEKI